MSLSTKKRTGLAGIGSQEDTSSVGGLYNIATKNNLQKDADRVLSEKGEDPNQIFSGGFIQDIFDGMSALQYGVTGVLKGKSFSEGIKTRQSFTDKDSLGNNGIPGIIAGTIMDIAVDPLTYVAPATIFKKIPGASKALGKATEIASQSKLGKYLGDKFVWMNGADPVFKNSYNKMVKNIKVGDQDITGIINGIVDLPEEKASKLLSLDETGRLKRNKLSELPEGLLSYDEAEKVKLAYSKLDELGQQAADLGLISKEKYEETLGEYIKNAYEKYENPEKKGLFGFVKDKISPTTKKRGEFQVTEEIAKELGQIKNPSYLLLKSMVDLNHDIQTAILFKNTAKTFGSDVAIEGYKRMPTSIGYTTTTGAKIGIKSQIKNINDVINPALKGLKETFKADKVTLGKIKRIENTLNVLQKSQADELTKFFQVGKGITKISPTKTTIQGVGKLPDTLKDIGGKADKYKSYNDFIKSSDGIEAERLFEEGILEDNGFDDIKDLFDFVKSKYQVTPEKVKETVVTANIPKILKLRKQISELVEKSTILKDIDKKSIDDSFRYLENIVNTGKFKKEDLIEEMGTLKLDDLAGKYVPEPIYRYLTDIQEAKSDSEKFLNKVVGEFKFNKVVLNPATHARNIMSNMVLNWWKLGVNPIKDAGSYAEAAKEMVKPGKWVEEAKRFGYGLDDFAANELKDSLLNGSKKGLTKQIKNVRDKLGDLYQKEESFAKLTAYISQRKKGVDPEKAWLAAESATFNYAQVTPFIRKLRSSIWGFPFITFTVKATPLALETAAKHPVRISSIGKIKQAIESQAGIEETEKERASEPAWIRNGLYVKLPMKDEDGNSAYFDLTYIIPFGDMVSGQFGQGKVSRETGLEESTTQALLSKSPAINIIKEIGKNEDFYGDKIWNDSDSEEQKLGDLMRYITKTFMPPAIADQIPGGYIQKGDKQGERRIRGIAGALEGGQGEIGQRDLMQEILKQSGIKIQPIDTDIQETYMDWEKRKALQSMLKEKGILSEFNKTYIPEE
jgi:hypothetical protein